MIYIGKRFMTLVITLFILSFINFFAFSLLPGDASVARLGLNATPERVEEIKEEMGLNDSLPVRYKNWLFSAIRGDFGESIQYKGVSVKILLAGGIVVTVFLAAVSFLIIIMFGMTLGILAAKNPNGWLDRLISGSGRMVMAIPPFFLGILLTFIFGIILKWFTPGVFVYPWVDFTKSLSYILFPALAISLPKVAMVVRYLRAAVIREKKKDYVRTAYSKGLSNNQVYMKHILKNALLPVITFIGIMVSEIIAGSIVVEQVFSLPGLGRLLVSAISNRDYPVIQGIVLFMAMVVILINFIVDLLYKWIDPRI